MNVQYIVAIFVCLFGSGGIALWLLNRIAKASDDRNSVAKDIKEIKGNLEKLQEGLTMALENDLVIFKALRTPEINGESEEQEEKMKKLPSTAPEEIKTIRVSQDKFEEYTGEYRKPYMITKDDGFKVGNVVKLVVFAAGKATGETADMRITCKDDDITCSGLSDGWCVIGLVEA